MLYTCISVLIMPLFIIIMTLDFFSFFLYWCPVKYFSLSFCSLLLHYVTGHVLVAFTFFLQLYLTVFLACHWYSIAPVWHQLFLVIILRLCISMVMFCTCTSMSIWIIADSLFMLGDSTCMSYNLLDKSVSFDWVGNSDFTKEKYLCHCS